jgi:hypothetical protein
VIADVIVAVASLACSLLLICMLQVEFRRSSRAFRWSIKALACCLLVYAFLPWLPDEGGEIVTVLMHLALLAVLGLVRWRQLRTGRCGAR